MAWDTFQINETAAAKASIAALQAELKDIATNPQNSRHAGYLKNDPAVSAYLDQRYREVYGTEAVNISDTGIGR